ncbi:MULTISPECIES: hypothetical protein [Parabacteroides]|uniref:hypothetical protein n=1 Tax=Parabacteroides TaxID=375288 RepID=UPI0018AB2A94|nr:MULTISPECIES: hypothetical protein [Parabacteroides]MDB9024264.1 hypothetical protein [Parabacteroides distasonis]MDB9042550.1 hypothetical protein [Parabacteroides distasonis]MDB9093555.1 hypothetical protein [Parabacteroides distasonis]MDB9159077.1 hypothetical protein [Parabacteroides distasonis]MDO5429665.1 hypothetical protein [Parabacteroides sp.]
MNSNIYVVHRQGDDTKKLYECADLFCMFFEPPWCWEFAVPFKFFEAVGHHYPLLSVNDLLIGKYIAEILYVLTIRKVSRHCWVEY